MGGILSTHRFTAFLAVVLCALSALVTSAPTTYPILHSYPSLEGTIAQCSRVEFYWTGGSDSGIMTVEIAWAPSYEKYKASLDTPDILNHVNASALTEQGDVGWVVVLPVGSSFTYQLYEDVADMSTIGYSKEGDWIFNVTAATTECDHY